MVPRPEDWQPGEDHRRHLHSVPSIQSTAYKSKHEKKVARQHPKPPQELTQFDGRFIGPQLNKGEKKRRRARKEEQEEREACEGGGGGGGEVKRLRTDFMNETLLRRPGLAPGAIPTAPRAFASQEGRRTFELPARPSGVTPTDATGRRSSGAVSFPAHETNAGQEVMSATRASAQPSLAVPVPEDAARRPPSALPPAIAVHEEEVNERILVPAVAAPAPRLKPNFRPVVPQRPSPHPPQPRPSSFSATLPLPARPSARATDQVLLFLPADREASTSPAMSRPPSAASQSSTSRPLSTSHTRQEHAPLSVTPLSALFLPVYLPHAWALTDDVLLNSAHQEGAAPAAPPDSPPSAQRREEADVQALLECSPVRPPSPPLQRALSPSPPSPPPPSVAPLVPSSEVAGPSVAAVGSLLVPTEDVKPAIPRLPRSPTPPSRPPSSKVRSGVASWTDAQMPAECNLRLPAENARRNAARRRFRTSQEWELQNECRQVKAARWIAGGLALDWELVEDQGTWTQLYPPEALAAGKQERREFMRAQKRIVEAKGWTVVSLGEQMDSQGNPIGISISWMTDNSPVASTSALPPVAPDLLVPESVRATPAGPAAPLPVPALSPRTAQPVLPPTASVKSEPITASMPKPSTGAFSQYSHDTSTTAPPPPCSDHHPSRPSPSLTAASVRALAQWTTLVQTLTAVDAAPQDPQAVEQAQAEYEALLEALHAEVGGPLGVMRARAADKRK